MKIVCIGSSSVEGIGDSRGIGWVGRFNELLNKDCDYVNQYRIFNLGLKGDLIKDTHKRYLSEALNRNSHVVIIFTGTNDVRYDTKNGKRYQLNPDYIPDWEVFVKDLKIAKHKTIILGPTRVCEEHGPMVITDNWHISFYNKDIELYNKQLKYLCDDNDVEFLELFNIFNDGNIEEYSNDCVHPNDKGYDLLAQVIYQELKCKNLFNDKK